MKIDYLHAIKSVSTQQGGWLLYGDEPLLQQNLLDAFRQYWHMQNIERQRFDLTSVNDWKLVLNALDSLSLFANQIAIEVYGNIKPDKTIQQQLNHFLQHHQNNSLIIVLPKQESSFKKSIFYQSFEKFGMIIHLQVHSSQEQQYILQLEAEKLGIHLDKEAWQWLLQHHEHHLLAGRNSLMLLANTLPEQQFFGLQHLLDCLQDQSRYTVYDLGDAILQGNFAQSIKILQHLMEVDEPMSLILWVLSREIRLLMQLYEQPENAIQLGIWKSKISLYQSAVHRLQPYIFAQFPDYLLRIDKSIKGIQTENTQHLCQQIIALLCNQHILTSR